MFLTLIALIVYNFFTQIGDKEHTDYDISDKFAFGVFFLLLLHSIFLVVLLVKNLISKNYKKAFGFISLSILLFFGLFFISGFLFISSLGSPPVDMGNINNFATCQTCKEFDINEVKQTVQNLRKGIYTDNLDSVFIESVKQDTSSLPKEITKIECGCSSRDTIIVVFRIWDIKNDTYQLEIRNINGVWKYEYLYYEFFD